MGVYREVYGAIENGAGDCTGYPLETEVADQVVYGNSGEFVGNRTDAQEANVKLGVEYGPNGTLFVGQYTGGSGTPGDTEWIG